MAFHYRTPGIVIKKEDKGEADQIFTIYTRDFGKLEILGKAIRKIKSKLRAGAELFYLSEIEFIQGKTYKTLTDAILIKRFEILRKDLKRLKIAYQISEILDSFVKEEEKEEKIWQLLNEAFNKLNNWTPPTRHPIENSLEIGNCLPAVRLRRSRWQAEKLEILYYYFLWNLLSLLGYQPELYNCAVCQKKIIPGKIYFHSREGGTICPGCFKKIKEKPSAKLDYCREINSDIVKILRIILKKDWSILSRLKIEVLHQKILADISEDFFQLFPC